MRGRAMLAGISPDAMTLRDHVDLANVLVVEGCTRAERDYIEARLAAGLPGTIEPYKPDDAPVTPARSRWAVDPDEWGADPESQAVLDAAAARAREGVAL